jgi:preprotein translocase subunit SecG
MYMLFVIVHVLVSIVLCVAVLLQSSKGGGLAGAFGGSGGAPQQILGSRGMTTLLHKVTIWCGIGFMVTSLALFMMSGTGSTSSGSLLENAQQSGTLDPDLPAPPIEDGALPPVAPAEEPAGGGQQDEPQGGGQ